MNVRWRTVLASVPFCVAAANATISHAAGDKRKADAVIVAQLPRFCWAQYMEGVSGLEYDIDPKSCGYGMNHYCPGVVALISAKRSFGDRNKRLSLLREAQTDTLYTLQAMKPYPGCFIRGHVEKTLNEVNGYLKGMGQK